MFVGAHGMREMTFASARRMLWRQWTKREDDVTPMCKMTRHVSREQARGIGGVNGVAYVIS